MLTNCFHWLWNLLETERVSSTGFTARKDTDGYLADLETLEYDILYGKRYALDGGSYPVMADMTMGTRPVRITEVTSDGNFIRVTGENFTRYSVVTVGGSEKKTQYVDEHTLIVEKDLLSGLGLSRTITLRQVTTNGKTLSESPPFLFAPTGSETATKKAEAPLRRERAACVFTEGVPEKSLRTIRGDWTGLPYLHRNLNLPVLCHL